MSRPALFLDRDGVLNENRQDHVKSWSEFRFLPGVLDALATLNSIQVPIVAITNQAAVHQGQVPSSTIDEIHQRMLAEVRMRSGRIDSVYYCPHRADENCSCRKPQPGLLNAAARDLDIDLQRSVLVGDWTTDIAAGHQVGCGTILVLTGRGEDARRQIFSNGHVRPDAIAADLQRAVPLIINLLLQRMSIRRTTSAASPGTGRTR